jgi:phosphatidylglycerophosphatase A
VNRLALALATWFGCGYFPWGPGTVGSLAAVGIAALLHNYTHLGRSLLAIFIVLLLPPAIWASTRAARLARREDPGFVVVDEVLGQWVTLMGATVRDWRTLVVAFVLFRIFDIWKPWPIRRFETLPDGLGIIADDLAAGVFGAVILLAGRTFHLY